MKLNQRKKKLLKFAELVSTDKDGNAIVKCSNIAESVKVIGHIMDCLKLSAKTKLVYYTKVSKTDHIVNVNKMVIKKTMQKKTKIRMLKDVLSGHKSPYSKAAVAYINELEQKLSLLNFDDSVKANTSYKNCNCSNIECITIVKNKEGVKHYVNNVLVCDLRNCRIIRK